MHSYALAPEYVPGRHGEHDTDPNNAYVPAAHGASMLVPLHENPSEHCSQLVRVALSPPDVKEPGGHSV